MHYEVDDANAVLVYVPSQDAPIVHQPTDPADGKPFKTKAAAAKWAETFVADWQAAQAAEPDPGI